MFHTFEIFQKVSGDGLDPKRSSEMRHGTGGPLLAIVALPMAVDLGEFEHFRAGAALSFRQLENPTERGDFGGVSNLHQRSDFTESWASQCL